MDTSALFVQQLSNYAVALQDLTFNSKPIINNLTITAGESKSCAEAIARLIEQRISTVARDQRLPVLYLLDSICKNIGSPYVGYFAENIATTFLSTYAVVTPQQRSSMMHLLRTWPPVFGSELVSKVSTDAAAIDAQAGLVTVPRSSAELGQTAPPVRVTNVATDRVAQLLAKSRAMSVPNALQQPPQLQPQQPYPMYQSPSPVTSTPTPTTPQVDLTSLLGQLASVVGGLQGPPQPQPAPFHQYGGASQGPAPSHAPYYQSASFPSNNGLYQGHVPPQVQYPSFQPPHQQQFYGNSGPSVSGPPIVRAPHMGGSSGAFHPPTGPPTGGHGPFVSPNAPPMSATHAGMGRPIGSTFDAELMKVRHKSVVDALYSDLQVQCKSCGLRFSDQSKMEPHMDWHFTRNRREKTKLRKPISRSWFLETHEWNAFEGREVFTHTAPFFEGAVVKEEEEEESVVRADDSQRVCSMCSEEFEKFWDSDQEDWMYRDAKRDEVGQSLVHTHCFLAAGEQVRSPASDEGSKSPTSELTLDAFREQQFSPPLATGDDEEQLVPSSSLVGAPSASSGIVENGNGTNEKDLDTMEAAQPLESIVGSKRSAEDALGSPIDPKKRKAEDSSV